jgi:hypothetical protein
VEGRSCSLQSQTALDQIGCLLVLVCHNPRCTESRPTSLASLASYRAQQHTPTELLTGFQGRCSTRCVDRVIQHRLRWLIADVEARSVSTEQHST